METKNINVREDKLYTNTVKDGEISPPSPSNCHRRDG